MNKKQFVELMKNEMHGKSNKNKLKFLERIQSYIEDMINKVLEAEKLRVKPGTETQYYYCRKCGHYIAKKKENIENKEEVRTVTTYRDCGYGDDDRCGEVEYLVKYVICPWCGEKQEISAERQRLIKEWYARTGEIIR